MKKRLLFFCLFLLSAAVSAGKFEIETIFRPAVVAAGEPVELVLISNKRGDLTFDLPEIKGGRWLKNYVSSSTQTSIVNGVVSVSVRRTIPLMTEKPGAIVIPPFTVKCGKESARTRELVIKVLASSDRSTVSGPRLPDPYGEITLPVKRRDFYVGEEIPLTVSLFLPVGLEIRELSYPELSGLGSAVLTDCSKINPRNRFFAPPQETRQVIGNTEYTRILFRASFRALKAGVITPRAAATAGIVHRSRSRTPRSMFDDDFFDGFFSGSSARVVPRQITFSFKGKINIQPLPPFEGDGKFLNLVGSWTVSAKLGSTLGKVGEPVELTVMLTGNGNGETLETPQLQIPGFRVYPPEVKRYPGRIEIKYALIPLAAGEKKFSLAFAVFDPVKRGYSVFRNELVLPVSPGETANTAKVFAPPGKKAKTRILPEPENVPTPQVRQELFYQKSSPGTAVKLPLMRNQYGYAVLIMICGIAAAVTLKLRAVRRERESNDSSFRRRKELHDQLKDVLGELKTFNYSADTIRGTAVPFLAESMGLPPGSTPEELAEKIDDPELADWLRALDHSGFMPGSSPKESAATSRRIKSLIKALKRYGIWLVILGTLPLSGGFNSAFDSGKYAQAETVYRKYISDSSWSSGALYNLGSVYFMQNDLPRARLCFMRALLISPGDQETLENLNLINRKLMQPEIGNTSTPLELLIWLRDRLRPDHYVLLAVLCAAALMILWGIKVKKSSAWWYWSAGVFAVMLLIFVFCSASQMAGPYDRRHAVVVVKDLKLRNLPVESGRIDSSLPGGGTAAVVETRDGWSRIKINGRDGWVRSAEIEKVFPGGLW